MPVLRLAIVSPLRQIFDYLPPPDCEPDTLAQLRPGCRVLAPFGARTSCGVLVEVAEHSDVPAERLKPARQILDPQPLISPSLMQLCEWAGSYYKHAPGEVLGAALPTALRKGKVYAGNDQPGWQLTTAGKALPQTALSRAPRQAEVLQLLLERDFLGTTELESREIRRDTLRNMVKKGLLEEASRAHEHRSPSSGPGPELNAEQRAAIAQVISADRKFAVWLLDGVTGSGKTEVYLQLIADTLASGRQALVLIPEIGLGPQTVGRFRQRFDAHIVVLHSGLAEGERLAAWDDARKGLADIVIGTRSAIFSSLANPGLIVVDEEHDSSYKQQEGFRYSARDIAVKRGQLEDIPVILGSATPSLESLANVANGRYGSLTLRQRASAGALPAITTQDVRHLPLQGALSPQLLDEIRGELAGGNQVLLFLNRRGYAPSLQCHDCGHVAGCIHCDARLTLHRAAAELRCHHCDWRCSLPGRCPVCRSSQLTPTGVGTEQAEEVLQQHFGDFPLYRVDRDSMQRKGSMDTLLEMVHSGEPCLLLGTQMLTKGHHFPDVTLVGLLDVDAALFSPDFRGAERMGQLVTQVAGRAGRASKPGRVILQTHYPDHPLLQVLLAQGYAEFSQQLLEERRQTGMPPFGQLLLLRAEARDMQSAETLLRKIREHGEESALGTARFVGPLPAPLQRKSGRWRAQLWVNTNSRAAAQGIAEQLVAHAEQLPEARRIRWSIDIDPIDMI